MKLHEFKQRLKLAIKIIFGYDIIVYEEIKSIVTKEQMEQTEYKVSE